MWQGLSSPNDPTGEQGTWDRGELHAMDDDEKLDEDKEEADNEEIGDEEQEEEHQKAREDHNLTHIPFSSWCNHCPRGGEDGGVHTQEETQMKEKERTTGAVTTYSIDYMYLTDVNSTLTRHIFSLSHKDALGSSSSLACAAHISRYLMRHLHAFMLCV